MSKASSQTLEAALHSIYDAALDRNVWPRALVAIGKMLDTTPPMIVLEPGTAGKDFITADDQGALIEVLRTDRRWLSDLFATGVRRPSPERRGDEDTIVDIRMTRLTSLLTSATGFGVQVAHPLCLDDGDRAELVLLLESGDPGLSPDQMVMLRSLGHAVGQSLRLTLRNTRATSNEVVLRAALDAANVSIHIVDNSGLVHFSNAHAQAQSDVYILDENGRLMPRAECERREFLTLLQTSGEMQDRALRRAILITATDGSPQVLWAIPISVDEEIQAGPCADERILLFTTPVRRENTIDPYVLRDLFELALGQARLAALVGGGLELRTAAERLGVTEGTARIVLKRVFRKLRINRQVELALLLSSLTQFSAPRTKPNR